MIEVDTTNPIMPTLNVSAAVVNLDRMFICSPPNLMLHWLISGYNSFNNLALAPEGNCGRMLFSVAPYQFFDLLLLRTRAIAP